MTFKTVRRWWVRLQQERAHASQARAEAIRAAEDSRELTERAANLSERLTRIAQDNHFIQIARRSLK